MPERKPPSTRSGNPGADTGSRDGRLTLRERNLRTRVQKLFRDTERDERFRQRFIENPTEVIATRLYGKKLEPQKVSDANRLLFSLVSNPEFRTWLEDYSRRNQNREVTQEQFANDFAATVGRLADPVIIQSLAVEMLEGNALANLGVVGREDCVAFADHRCLYIKAFYWARIKARADGFEVEHGLESLINPVELRRFSELVTAHGEALRRTGQLADLRTQLA